MTTTDAISVEVPDIGEFEDVPIIEILVAPGDQVATDDPLLTLESDKATMDVPAPFAGVVRELLVGVGDRVSQGTPLLTLEPSGEDRSPEPEPLVAGPAAVAEPDRAVESDGAGPIYASPSIRRVARELGIDLTGVSGTGRKGRITREDVERQARGALAGATRAAPGVAAGAIGEEERVPLTRIQRIAAPRLASSWATIPHVTHNDEADITELEAWRKELNTEQLDDAGAARSGEAGSRAGGKPAVKVTMVSFLVVACVATLKEFPTFNSSLDGEELILKRYYNIGFAADTPAGLVVPVIKGADQKGLLEIAAELTELSGRAREGKLTPGDISGSTFTISSLGGIGGTSFTPIVNAPEVAILGVTRAAMKPVWDGSAFVPRLIVPLSLSYDHRVIDGAAAARFMVHLVRVLSDLRRALL